MILVRRSGKQGEHGISRNSSVIIFPHWAHFFHLPFPAVVYGGESRDRSVGQSMELFNGLVLFDWSGERGSLYRRTRKVTFHIKYWPWFDLVETSLSAFPSPSLSNSSVWSMEKSANSHHCSLAYGRHVPSIRWYDWLLGPGERRPDEQPRKRWIFDVVPGKET